MTVVFFSVMSGLVTALVMSCAVKRGKRKGRLEDGRNEVEEKGPIYDAPRGATGTKEVLALRENVCYNTTSITTSSKLD